MRFTFDELEIIYSAVTMLLNDTRLRIDATDADDVGDLDVLRGDEVHCLDILAKVFE